MFRLRVKSLRFGRGAGACSAKPEQGVIHLHSRSKPKKPIAVYHARPTPYSVNANREEVASWDLVNY